MATTSPGLRTKCIQKVMKNIHPIFDQMISRVEREKKLNQRSKVLWLTGLSGSGKSTIAIGLERLLFKKEYFAQVIDGDNIRNGLNNNLGFSQADRTENIRRISEVAKLYLNSGIITICSFISPTIEIRNLAKQIIGAESFIEIFINTPLSVCEARDVKGLYKKARAGEIINFTGIDSPYEHPIYPDLKVDTENMSVQESVDQIFNFIQPQIESSE